VTHNYDNKLMRILDIKRGNVYEHLSEEENNWLIEEAIKLDRCDVGLVIAAIIKDAYAEEQGE
jgi:hypothetical protein